MLWFLASFTILTIIFTLWSFNRVTKNPRKGSAILTIAFGISAMLVSKAIQDHLGSSGLEDYIATVFAMSIYAIINLIVLSLAKRRRNSQINYKNSERFKLERAANQLDIFLLLIPLFSPLIFLLWFAMTWSLP